MGMGLGACRAAGWEMVRPKGRGKARAARARPMPLLSAALGTSMLQGQLLDRPGQPSCSGPRTAPDAAAADNAVADDKCSRLSHTLLARCALSGTLMGHTRHCSPGRSERGSQCPTDHAGLHVDRRSNFGMCWAPNSFSQ